MRISDKGLALVESLEDFHPVVYMDNAGLPTIGYGHKLKPVEAFPNGVTDEEATALLREDVAMAEHAVNTFVKVPLTQGQYDSLVDFAYSVGGSSLEHSTLLRLLNEGKYEEAAAQFVLWDHAGSDGLLRRREAERAMFTMPRSRYLAPAESRPITNCTACKNPLCPRQRHGIFVGHLLLLMGFYPWECLNCGMSYYLHQSKTRHLDQTSA
jgi:lysozyme